MDSRQHLFNNWSFTSPFLHWYRIILHGDWQKYKSVNNLRKVVTELYLISWTQDLSVNQMSHLDFTIQNVTQNGLQCWSHTDMHYVIHMSTSAWYFSASMVTASGYRHISIQYQWAYKWKYYSSIDNSGICRKSSFTRNTVAPISATTLNREVR